MYTSGINSDARLMKLMLGVVAALLLTVASAGQAQAQLLPAPPPPTDVTLNYAFSVPVAKVVPNPCTGGFTLITGSANFSIETVQSGSTFKLTINSSSAGKGEDALPDGTLLLDGTQKPQYNYTSTTFSDAVFPEKPTDVLQTLTIGEYLARTIDSDVTDAFAMKTVFEITYLNGVPAVPVLREISTKCMD